MKVKNVLVLISLLFFLSSCQIYNYNYNFLQFENLLQTPKLSQKQQLLKNNIEDYLNSEVILNYYPVNGRYSSIAKVELDNSEESTYKIAFCEAVETPDDIHILILKLEELKQWRVVGEINLKKSDLEMVYVKDIDDDDKNEILVCRKSQSDDNIICTEVYSYDNFEIVYLGTLKDDIF